MHEDDRTSMIEAYLNGGVSSKQILELGEDRPEISKFLAFSRAYESVPFRSLWNFGGIEFCFSYEAEFMKIDIDGQTLARCMDADTEVVRSTCRKILTSMQASREQIELGETHLVGRGIAVSTTAVKAFILATLDAMERYGNKDVIPELYFLLSQVLFPGKPEAEAVRSSANLKQFCGVLAWAYNFKYGKYPSYRKLSKILNVAPSTISRMFASTDELETTAKCYALLSDDPRDLTYLKNIYPSL